MSVMMERFKVFNHFFAETKGKQPSHHNILSVKTSLSYIAVSIIRIQLELSYSDQEFTLKKPYSLSSRKFNDETKHRIYTWMLNM